MMLNLSFNSAYQYLDTEKKVINSLKKKYGKKFQFTHGKSKKMVWYDGQIDVKKIKNNISRHVLGNTRFRCSFCGKRLTGSSKPIEHFIPNKKYPKYSFHPLNLLACCSYCNSDLKKEFDPIVSLHKKYHKIIFSIVHPILDDVDAEFKLKNEGIDFDLINCSVKAKSTIALFNWTSLEHQLTRASIHILEIFQPLSDLEISDLVNQCATYKSKRK